AYRVRSSSPVLTDTLQVDPDKSSLEETYSIKTFHDLGEALAAKPTATFICNPTSHHLPIALEAARAGSHLFIEKPVSHSLDGTSELLNIVQERDLTTYVGYQLRFHPCIAFLKDKLRSGAVGRVLCVRATVGEHLPSWHPYEDYRQMYASRKDQGGGVILSQIHEFDYLYMLFGAPLRVFALGGHLSSLEVDVEDVASILMEYRIDGQTLPVHLNQDYLQRPPQRTCEVVGDEGKLAIDFHALSAVQYRADGELAEEHSYTGFNRNQLFVDELEHFFACLGGKARSQITLNDGLQSLKMALCAKQSLETGAVVEL
ncbi:MAG: Gfo/Idh/MocA family protein, partial [Rhodothermia bacterium]